MEDVLKERQKSHGDFSDNARIMQLLKYSMRSAREGEAWYQLHDYEREALEMIAHKIGRILSGNPHYKDHWVDIAGYATLVAQRVPQ